MRKRFYITTPIYYVNDELHLGHAYTTTVADILARWHRKLGKDVFFLTGSDEHGAKIEEAASKKGKRPEELTDEQVLKFKRLWKKLKISYDFFIRTTDNYHSLSVKSFVKKLYEKGDIYKGVYEGHYCIGCEQYYTPSEAPDLICPIHKRKLINMKEKCYFFKLSKYKDTLLELYEKNPDFLSPKHRAKEIINRVKEGLKDLCITRKNVKWGIHFPIEEEYTIYVWFEALLNYISALQATGNLSFWPADVHIVGKDIFWFHAVIWPAMLLAAGYEPPKKVFAHGWWTIDREKMSKSLGNVVKPEDIVDRFGLDPFRYYLIRAAPFGEDGDFSEKRLVEYLNNELANDLGNLVSRVIGLAERKLDSYIGEFEIKEEVDKELIKEFNILEKITKYMENLEVNKALSIIWNLIKKCNSYLNKVEPWKIENKNRLEEILGLMTACLRYIAIYIEPFLPITAEKILQQINIKEEKELEFKIYKNIKLGKREVLFKKISLEESNDSNELCLRIGKILEIKEHPNADKLFIEKIDIGDKIIQVISGLREHYTKEELESKKVVVLCNLKPAKIRGDLSEGMILVGDDGKKIGLLLPQGEPGEFIRTSKNILNSNKELSLKRFQKIDFIVKDGKVLLEGEVLRTNKGIIKIDKEIQNGKIF